MTFDPCNSHDLALRPLHSELGIWVVQLTVNHPALFEIELSVDQPANWIFRIKLQRRWVVFGFRVGDGEGRRIEDPMPLLLLIHLQLLEKQMDEILSHSSWTEGKRKELATDMRKGKREWIHSTAAFICSRI
ncbi:hypothetical protein ACFX13_045534 [Malus domestica]